LTLAMPGATGMTQVLLGCAGWAIRTEHAALFPGAGSHLHRYAQRFNAVEINSSFYRPHKVSTYARWADSVPDDFRFSAKVPKEITHARRLVGTEEILERFLTEVAGLGPKLGGLLLQLPPGLSFDRTAAADFLDTLRRDFAGSVFCEPRHTTWFTEDAEELLLRFRIGRVAADPALLPAAAVPSGYRHSVYYRLHGSPQMYYSAYSELFLDSLAGRLMDGQTGAPRWCIFDNTALGSATTDAIALQSRLQGKSGTPEL
jgi:uncharacterized protein YecE (DUF72 family)